MKLLGHTIAKIGKMRGVSQGQLSKATGVTRTYINLIETGKKTPTIGLLEKICEVLSVPVGALIWLAESSEKVDIEKYCTPGKLKYKSPINEMMKEMFDLKKK